MRKLSNNYFLEIHFIISPNLVLVTSTGLVFSEYLLSGQASPVKDVNEEEPLFPAVPFLNSKSANKVSHFSFFIWLIIHLPR